LKIAQVATVLLLGIVLVSGLACGNSGVEPTPTPGPDPTPPPVGGSVELPEAYQYSRMWARDDETIVMHVSVKDEKSRIDWSLYETSPAKNEKIKFIDDGEYKWIYDIDEHWAAKYLTEDVVHQAEEHLLWFSENYYGNMSESTVLSEMQAACDSDAQCSDVAITGHETVDGQLCTKYTYRAYNDSEIVYWISNSGYLVQVEYTDTAGWTTTMKFTDIDLNPSISDDIFDISKVAPGAIIVDMSAS
jgi:outer membrane lipoprotein-sorting protein